MKHSIAQEDLQIKHAGLAVECGTLDVLIQAVMLQPVLMMPLTRTMQQGNAMIVRQWCVHLTARQSHTSPVYYATFRAAEVVVRHIGSTLTAPYPEPQFQRNGEDMVQEAMRLQESLVSCLQQVVTRGSRVTHVIAPVRYRLPDEWVWSAQGSDPSLTCEQGGLWRLTGDAEAGSAESANSAG